MEPGTVVFTLGFVSEVEPVKQSVTETGGKPYTLRVVKLVAPDHLGRSVSVPLTLWGRKAILFCGQGRVLAVRRAKVKTFEGVTELSLTHTGTIEVGPKEPGVEELEAWGKEQENLGKEQKTWGKEQETWGKEQEQMEEVEVSGKEQEQMEEVEVRGKEQEQMEEVEVRGKEQEQMAADTIAKQVIAQDLNSKEKVRMGKIIKRITKFKRSFLGRLKALTKYRPLIW